MSAFIKIIDSSQSPLTEEFPSPEDVTRVFRMDAIGSEYNYSGNQNILLTALGQRVVEPMIDYQIPGELTYDSQMTDVQPVFAFTPTGNTPDLANSVVTTLNKPAVSFFPYKPLCLFTLPGSNNMATVWLFGADKLVDVPLKSDSKKTLPVFLMRVYLCVSGQNNGQGNPAVWSSYLNKGVSAFTNLDPQALGYVYDGNPKDFNYIEVLENMYLRSSPLSQQNNVSGTAISVKSGTKYGMNAFRLIVWGKDLAWRMFGYYRQDPSTNGVWDVVLGNYLLPSAYRTNASANLANAPVFFKDEEPYADYNSANALMVEMCNSFALYDPTSGRVSLSPPAGGGMWPSDLPKDQPSNLGTLPPTEAQFINGSMQWVKTRITPNAFSLVVNANFLYVFGVLGIERFQIKATEDTNKSGNVRLDLEKDNGFFLNYIIRPGTRAFSFKTYVIFVNNIGNPVFVDQAGQENRVENIQILEDVHMFGYTSSSGEDYVVINDIAISLSSEHSFFFSLTNSGTSSADANAFFQTNFLSWQQGANPPTLHNINFNLADIYSDNVFYNSGEYFSIVCKCQEYLGPNSNGNYDLTEHSAFLTSPSIIKPENISMVNDDNAFRKFDWFVQKYAKNNNYMKVWGVDRKTFFYIEEVPEKITKKRGAVRGGLRYRYWAPYSFFIFNKTFFDENIYVVNDSVMATFPICGAESAGMVSSFLRSSSGNLLKISNITLSLDGSTYVNPFASFEKTPLSQEVEMVFYKATPSNFFFEKAYWEEVTKTSITLNKGDDVSEFQSSPSILGWFNQISGYNFQLKWEMNNYSNISTVPKLLPIADDPNVILLAKTGLYNWYLVGLNSVTYG